MPRCELPIQVLRWALASVGENSRLVDCWPLLGATSSHLYALDVGTKEGMRRLVLRLYTNRRWLDEEIDLPQHEADSLRHAGRGAVPVPGLVALDAEGAACGVPALLMTRLVGNVILPASPCVAWLTSLARALASLHEISPWGFPYQYRPYVDHSRIKVPSWSSEKEHWARAIEALRDGSPAGEKCFIHRDYHPCNVLWDGDRLSGIIDWPNACVGPAAVDVAHCRHNLVYLYGLCAADTFAQAYRSETGRPMVDLVYWDLCALCDWLPGPPRIYDGWRAAGCTHLTDGVMRQRADAFLRAAVDAM